MVISFSGSPLLPHEIHPQAAKDSVAFFSGLEFDTVLMALTFLQGRTVPGLLFGGSLQPPKVALRDCFSLATRKFRRLRFRSSFPLRAVCK